jgi:hypothetical protein
MGRFAQTRVMPKRGATTRCEQVLQATFQPIPDPHAYPIAGTGSTRVSARVPIPALASAPARCHCGAGAVLRDTRQVWPSLRPVQPLWLCSRYPACDSYVRCHPDTTVPMGSLAGPRLRKLRGKAHEVFDPLWREGGAVIDRGMAYVIAGRVMGIEDLHIGQMSERQCLRFIERIEEIEDALLDHADRLLNPARCGDAVCDLLRLIFDVQAPRPRVRASRLLDIEMPMADLIAAGWVSVELEEGAGPAWAVLTALGVAALSEPHSHAA